AIPPCGARQPSGAATSFVMEVQPCGAMPPAGVMQPCGETKQLKGLQPYGATVPSGVILLQAIHSARSLCFGVRTKKRSSTTRLGRDRAPQSTGLAAVEAQVLAVGQYDALEPDDLLAVGELIADARDYVAGLVRRLCYEVGLQPCYGGVNVHS